LGKSLAVEATWEGNYRCRVRTGSHELVIDEPESAGGGGAGPQPTEVFLASLASCFTLAVHHVARKRDITLPDLSVRAVGEYEGPKFVSLRVEVTSTLAADQLAPLLERAAAVCYVSNTIRVVDHVEVVLATAAANEE
jgi:putative redox protein